MPFALVASILAAAPVLQLDVGPDAPCALASVLRPALESEGIEVAGADAASPWRLETIASSDGVTLVRLLGANGALVGQRSFRLVSADCPILPKTIAMLAKSWTSQELEATRPSEAPEADQPGAPTPVAPVPELRRPPRRHHRSAASREVAAPSAPDSDAVAATEPMASSPDEPVGSVPNAEGEQAQAPEPVRPQSWAVELLGGVALTFPEHAEAVGQGQLSAEWGFAEPFGLALEGGAQTARVASAAPGSVSAELQWLSAMVRLRFDITRSGELWAGLGVRLARLAASSHGYLVDASAVLLTGGAVAAAEWRQTFVAGFFVALRAEGQLRWRAESFSVDGVGHVLTVPPWGVALGLGVGWTFR